MMVVLFLCMMGGPRALDQTDVVANVALQFVLVVVAPLALEQTDVAATVYIQRIAFHILKHSYQRLLYAFYAH
jgi:hypothetical protein